MESAPKDLIPIIINGKTHHVNPDFTIYQACSEAGIEIPTFCYHPKLSIAGNCRMCLVEIKGAPKLAASCAMPLRPEMEIFTDSDKVKTTRKAVLEFLLINHPLDCPICDQGGECDLQDLTMAYGPGTSRFHEHKRAVPRKDFGPLIRTEMTRCIHCMRCVRFGRQIAGVDDLGALGRGEHAEITTVVGNMVTSELSGNMIDICPVGALTAKPFAFQGRAWEFQHTDGIDIHDAVGSHIRIDTRGTEVMRIVPRAQDDLNEDWISDKTRFSFDGLKRQRLDRPYVREGERLVAASWSQAFETIGTHLTSVKPSEIGVLVGDLADAESLFALKTLMTSLGVTLFESREEKEFLPTQQRRDYLFNTTLQGIERADLALLIGTNPRYEASMVNTRLRKAYLDHNLPVAALGPQVDLTYPVTWLGDNVRLLEEWAHGTHPYQKNLAEAERPLMILGSALLTHPQSELLYGLCRTIAQRYGFIQPHWNGFNILQRQASRVAALDMGFYCHSGLSLHDQLKKKTLKVLYVLGADRIDPELLKDVFVIYQGSHGDQTVYSAHVILPGAAYPEKEGTYVNLEGRVQRSLQAVAPVGEAKEDWRLLAELGQALGRPLPFENIHTLRAALEKAYPSFGHLFELPQEEWKDTQYEAKGTLKKTSLTLPVPNFYQTDVISRASEVMARCTQVFLDHSQKEVRYG